MPDGLPQLLLLAAMRRRRPVLAPSNEGTPLRLLLAARRRRRVALAPPSNDGSPLLLLLTAMRRRRPVPPPAADMMAAVVQQLRATPMVVAALGEDTSSLKTTKIWADDLAMEPKLPYVTYSEPRGSKSYSTGGAYIESGTFVLSVLGMGSSGTGKFVVRTLSQMLVDALDDQEQTMLFLGGRFLYIREDVNAASTVSAVGPETSTVYKRQITMKYMIVGTI